MIETIALFGISVEKIFEAGGILLIAAIIFAESGLLIGFFLPGDTLLFGAGLYASQGQFSLPLPALIAIIVIAAVLGDNVGYSIGRRTGHRLFKKKNGILFRQEYLEQAERFYENHGGKTIIMARFVPVVRTFAPVVAGVGKMSRARFFSFNIVGGALWGAGMPLLGYYIGDKIPHLDKYIELVMVGVVTLSLVIAFAHLLKDKQTRDLIIARLKLALRNVFLNKKID